MRHWVQCLQPQGCFTGFPVHQRYCSHSDSYVFPRYPQISNAQASAMSVPGGKNGLHLPLLLWVVVGESRWWWGILSRSRMGNHLCVSENKVRPWLVEICKAI